MKYAFLRIILISILYCLVHFSPMLWQPMNRFSRAPPLGAKFVLIPAGTFMRGSPDDEPDRSSNEEQYKVKISKPFYMQTTEVTQGQWQEGHGEQSF